MRAFTEDTTLEHIVSTILEAGNVEPYREAIHAAGARNVIDFMIIRMADLNTVEWNVTTQNGNDEVVTKKTLNLVQRCKLEALQEWGKNNGTPRSDEEWLAFTASEFDLYLELHMTGSVPTSGGAVIPSNKKKTVEEKIQNLQRMRTDDKFSELKDAQWALWYNKFQVAVELKQCSSVLDEGYKPTTTEEKEWFKAQNAHVYGMLVTMCDTNRKARTTLRAFNNRENKDKYMDEKWLLWL
jgi:hypothetical protein